MQQRHQYTVSHHRRFRVRTGERVYVCSTLNSRQQQVSLFFYCSIDPWTFFIRLFLGTTVGSLHLHPLRNSRTGSLINVHTVRACALSCSCMYKPKRVLREG